MRSRAAGETVGETRSQVKSGRLVFTEPGHSHGFLSRWRGEEGENGRFIGQIRPRKPRLALFLTRGLGGKEKVMCPVYLDEFGRCGGVKDVAAPCFGRR